MSLGRSSRFASLALLRKNLRKCCPPLHLHPPSPFIMVVWCVARILGTDVGKTLMNMEMLKFLKARSVTRLYPWYQLECAFHLPSCSITIVSFPNWVCHSFEFFQTIICKLPYAGIKSFNDLCIKSNSFCHLREMLYESPFPKVSRYGIMAITSSLLWNHAPSYSSVELLPIQLNLCHLPLSIAPDVLLCLNLRDVLTSHSVN